MRSTPFFIQNADSFYVAHTKSDSMHGNRGKFWRKAFACASAILTIALALAALNQHGETSLVSRNSLAYTELALIPASRSETPKDSTMSPDVSVLKSDFNSNLRLLKAAGGLDLKKVPQLDGSSQVV